MKNKSLGSILKAVASRHCAILVPAMISLTAGAEEIVINPPGGDADAVPLFVEALQMARAKGISTVRINPGEYHIYPDMAPERFVHVTNHDHGLRRTALPIWDMENLTIEAQGATLLAHRQAFIPITVHNSKNITINGLTIDWAEPLHLQGMVESVDPESDSFVARMQHPERIVIKHNKLYYGDINRDVFLSHRLMGSWQLQPHLEWIQNPEWTVWFDSKTGAPLDEDRQHHIRDWGIKQNRPSVVEDVGEGRYRLRYTVPRLPDVGHVFVSKGMYSFNRMSPGIHLQNAENVVFNQLAIHYAGGMGLIAQRCRDVTLDRIRVVPAEGSGRWVSTLADATHFNLCQGKIVIKDSTFEYMLDDATNVHGVSVPIVSQTGPKSICGELQHFQQFGLVFAKPGERLRFSRQSDLVAYGERTVESVRRINSTRFEVTFTESIEDFVQPGSFLDNLDCQPDLIFTGNRVANNYARSLIFSTEGKVLVADNRFEQPAMHICKVKGDANFWFESGPVRDVTIKNNVFISRNTAVYMFDFGPEEMPLSKKSDVPFHSNIKMLDNEFYLASPMIIRAYRVDGFEFSGNVIRASQWYEPDGRKKSKSMDIERCRNVTVAGNTVEVPEVSLAWEE